MLFVYILGYFQMQNSKSNFDHILQYPKYSAVVVHPNLLQREMKAVPD
jgi:hypothetical protein